MRLGSTSSQGPAGSTLDAWSVRHTVTRRPRVRRYGASPASWGEALRGLLGVVRRAAEAATVSPGGGVVTGGTTVAASGQLLPLRSGHAIRRDIAGTGELALHHETFDARTPNSTHPTVPLRTYCTRDLHHFRPEFI